MTTIINLIGASGSGKTTIAYQLENVEVIESYTTRPKRHKEEKGHIFIDEAEEKDDYLHCKVDGYEVDFDKEHLIAIKKYGDNYYWASCFQVIPDNINIYIVDPDGSEQVKDFYKYNPYVKVISIYLNVDKNIRKDRLIKRYLQASNKEGHINTCLDYKKALQKANDRLERDKRVFQTIKCDYVISNNKNIDKTLKAIKQIIKKER